MSAPGAAFCRDCLRQQAGAAPRRCESCGSPRLVVHPERDDLAIAHIDCDAFYAAVEKRDDPSLRDKPLIIGGGKRGVVATCCYIARTYGVRSAMPMFKALALCPDAVVRKPDMAHYVEVGPAGARDDARPHAAGRAALHRRGISRSDGHEPAARRAARLHAGAIFKARRERDRHQRFGGAELLQVPGEDRLRSRQAARFRRHRPRRGARVSGEQARGRDLGRRRGGAGKTCARGLPHHRRHPGA